MAALLLEAIVDGFDYLVAHYLNIRVKYLNQFEGTPDLDCYGGHQYLARRDGRRVNEENGK